MFNKDFYPTPKNIIDLMVSEIDVFEKHVLEPSAGKGDIVDNLKNRGAIVSGCEKDKNLAEITQSKVDKWLGFDFLATKSEQASHLDFIIMNPPFSKDETHILHAWEIAPEGCVIKALCNWETVENTYVRRRGQLLKIIADNGRKENIGHCFSTAERKTNVEVGLITLYKPKKGEDEFEGYFDMQEEAAGHQASGIIQHNEIREIVNRYVGAVRMFEEVEKLSQKINNLAAPFDRYSDIKFGAYQTRGSYQTKITRDSYKKDLQKAAWKTVFSKMKMDKYVTKSVMEKLNAFVEKQGNVPFKMSNIFKMIDAIYQTYEQNMDKAIIELFDKLTYHSADNRHHVEGWKSNSQYLVSKKFIMPWMIKREYGFGLIYNGNGYLVDDLSKALCFLTGTNYEKIGDIWSFFHGKNKPDTFGKWYDWGFFEFKGFKKGTAHFRFKDENEWALLNQRIAKIKGWQLPEKTQ